MSERNLILKILSPEGIEKGQLKSEIDLSKELKELKLPPRNENRINIIHFVPYSYNIDTNISYSYPAKYAAKTDLKNKTEEEYTRFFTAEETDIALKLSGNSQNIFRVSFIASPNIDTEEAILYYKEMNNYFLRNERDEFILGTYDKKVLPNFDFKLLFPFDKIELIKDGNEINIIGVFDKIKIIEVSFIEDNVLITIDTKEMIKAIVFKNSHKGFISYKENIMSFHKSLLSDRNKILFY